MCGLFYCLDSQLNRQILERMNLKKAIALKDSLDGYIVYTMTLVWSQRAMYASIAALGKPLVIADEFLGGCGVFLTGYSDLCDRAVPAAAVSSRSSTRSGSTPASPPSRRRNAEQIATLPSNSFVRATPSLP